MVYFESILMHNTKFMLNKKSLEPSKLKGFFPVYHNIPSNDREPQLLSTGLIDEGYHNIPSNDREPQP